MKMPMLFSMILFSALSFAQEEPKIIETQVLVGAGVVSQNSGQEQLTQANGELEFSSEFYNPFNQEQKLLPFRIEMWFSGTPTPAQIRTLELNVYNMILDENFSVSFAAIKHQKDGIYDEQTQFTGISPALVNFKQEIRDGKIVFEGYIGAGLASGLEKEVTETSAYSDRPDLNPASVGFYLPVGMKVYGETDLLKWKVEGSYEYASSEQRILVRAGPRVRTYHDHNVYLQKFHVGAEVELKLASVIKNNMLKGTTLFARANFSMVDVKDRQVDIKLVRGYSQPPTKTVLNDQTHQLQKYTMPSVEVGIKINIGGGKNQKRPR